MLCSMNSAMEESWRVLVSLFPSDWEELARQSGAIERLRGFRSVEALMRVLLVHFGQGYSLRETVVQARVADWARVSDVALLKRLRRAEEWLRELCAQLLAENGVSLPALSQQRRIRIVDGTIVKEPGKTGSQWRILYSLRLPQVVCDFFEITPTAGTGNGESLSRVPVTEGDLLLADAGYGQVGGIASAVARGADVLVRINPKIFNAENSDGSPYELLKAVEGIKEAGEVGEWRVSLPGDFRVTGKVCALRKSQQAIEKAHRRLRRRESKKQMQVQPETWKLAEYVMVFTSCKAWPAIEVLEWYRVRWQVELTFKRLKSLAQLGHLPKLDDRSSRAWLYGKLFVALLTQKLVRQGRDLSPWGYALAYGSPSK